MSADERSSGMKDEPMRFLTIPLIFFASVASAQDRPSGDPNPLVGMWKVETYMDTPVGGKPIRALGDHPVGVVMFTDDGHVSIVLMPIPASRDASVGGPDSCVPSWYCSYYGTYTYTVSPSSWTTHVVGGTIASYVGTDQPRPFRIEGDKMILSETYEAAGRTYRADRVLRKIK